MWDHPSTSWLNEGIALLGVPLVEDSSGLGADGAPRHTKVELLVRCEQRGYIYTYLWYQRYQR